MNTVFSRRAQTATEYLIILAIVIVIALIVVGTLGGIPGIGGGAGSNADRAQLASLTVGILNYKQDSHSTLLEFRNNNPVSIQINGMSINGKKCTLYPYNSQLSAGQSKQITCYGVVGLDEGSRFEYDFNITYTDIKTQAQYVITPDVELIGTIVDGSELHTGQQECYQLDDGDNGEAPIGCSEPNAGGEAKYDGTDKSFTTLSDNIIKDDHTGLMWITNESASIDAATSLTYCDTVSNGGYGDWRLPNIVELLTVLGSSTTIDGNPSPNGDSWGDGIYWSTTQNTGGTRYNAQLAGGTGNQGYFYINYWTATDKPAVCVRGTTTGITLTDGVDSAKRFINIGDGTVVDTDTGIVWERAGTSNKEWNNSIVHCNTQETGGYTDWRLPTASEGVTLIDYADAGYKNAVFDWTAGDYYWTGTTPPSVTGVAYFVSMDVGFVFYGNKVNAFSVRCVRDHG